LVYIADTWNSRVQMFREVSRNRWEPATTWRVNASWGKAVVNKPYLAVSPDGQVCVSDPDGYRMLCFSAEGRLLALWKTIGAVPSGVAFDARCSLWVSETNRGRVAHFLAGLSLGGRIAGETTT
jgi:hypothetical protein